MTRLLAAFALLGLAGCATLPTPPPPATAPFSHADFQQVLERHVGADGLVDYAGIAADRAALDRYLAAIEARSPDTQPAAFPTEADRLAYWLNAYNAIAFHFVLAHHPLQSVQDLKPWWALPLPEGAGFFVGLRFPIGGDETHLYDLENWIVRDRFVDARIHFALNCASLGCPRLPAEAFEPARLEEQLERETQLFLGEPRNLRIDAEARTVHLSEILLWFEGDFVKWQRHRGGDPSLLGFVADHVADPAQAAELAQATREGWRIERIVYDWRLNDRALGPRPALAANAR